MATSDVSKKVLLLKLQLSESAESKTVLETLNKLQELDITIDILAETGIGKTVNSLRKHEDAGEIAKSLVRNWKKLVPKDPSSSQTEEGETSQGKHSQTEEKQNSSKDECVETEDQNKQDSNQDGPKTDDEDHGTSKRDLNAEDKKRDISEREQPQEVEKEEKVEIKADVERKADVEKKQDETEMKGHFKCENEIQKNVRREHLNNELEEHGKNGDGGVNSVKKHCKDSENDDDNDILENRRSEKSHKKRWCVSNEDSKANVDTDKKSRTKRSAAVKTSKSERDGNGTVSDIDNFQINKKAVEEADSLTCHRKKREPSEKKQACVKDKVKHEKYLKKAKDKKVAKVTHEDKLIEKDLDVPSMSFESYLSYDLKTPKKRKKSGDGKKSTKKSKTVEKPRQFKESNTKSIKLSKVSEDLSLPKVDKKGSVMDLLNVPLPAFLPECDELSHFQYLDRRVEEKASGVSVSQEAPILSGQRLNKKTQVYSGAKITFLPTMMTLYQQCIRALQNNIDLLYEIGGVPFEILEPVLERCKPDQLLRVEECNPGYIGLTDHLWEKHCQRDFRDARLEEYESWREMHLRLSEERERKLQRLTKSIASAHSGKPKGRQVKLAFIHSDAKPPRNVRIKQDIYGTAGVLQHPRTDTSTSLDRPSVKTHDNRPRPTYIKPARPSTTASGSSQVQDPNKKKRVAPMMAKSLKAFRKQLGRR